MKFYLSMPDGLKQYYLNEIKLFHQYVMENKLQVAWRHLERAHILGQPWAIEHTSVHLQMLKFGFRIKSAKEIAGQIPRLLIGGVKSFVGEIPVGNTGGANVPPLRPMEIPEDLRQWMAPYLD